jgi:CRISPR-associated protein Csm2
MQQPYRQHDRGRPTPGGRGGSAPAVSDQLPTAQPMKYFTDTDKKNLDPALIDEQALAWAKSFVEQTSNPLKSTQMRRFYDEFKAIERKVLRGRGTQEQEANFDRDRALIMMFKAKAVYAEKRRVSPRTFTEFIFNHMASINDLKDFQAFIKVFEAVVAYHRFYAKEN